MDPIQKSELVKQIAARRTFAIISHPDAGKTTLTERLLLYSGMIRTAGMVRARKGQKSASSDWMAMEQERGISITASAMQFPYKGSTINVLDTPGHQDFSEDTYRTLTAADSAIMVIDAAKGVETQTRKLFSVCRMRGIPVLTFINKMDLPPKDLFELMEEVEEVLGIHASPMNWPVGDGPTFCGVANCSTRELTIFNKISAGGSKRAESRIATIEEARTEKLVESALLDQVEYDLELLKEAGNPFTQESFLKMEVTPVFFGSAISNFGVEPFFDAFVDLAPAPFARPATTDSGEQIAVDPVEQPFSASVFKIQANMNPKHRDSMAFMRICSGRFERDMTCFNHRMKKEVRLSRSHSMLAGERSTLDFGYPGDVIGVINPGAFRLGDTLSIEGGFQFRPMPQFSPEVVASIRPKDVSKRKAFDKGLEQLSNEGAIQVLRPYATDFGDPYVAAVGRLQFEVLEYRLKEEYGVDVYLEITQHECGAWLEGDPKSFKKPSSALLVRDKNERAVVLFRTPWEKNYAQDQNPNHSFLDFVQ
jgi:peptide chain release factor 3